MLNNMKCKICNRNETDNTSGICGLCIKPTYYPIRYGTMTHSLGAVGEPFIVKIDLSLINFLKLNGSNWYDTSNRDVFDPYEN
jgi:hypothetical protein